MSSGSGGQFFLTLVCEPMAARTLVFHVKMLLHPTIQSQLECSFILHMIKWFLPRFLSNVLGMIFCPIKKGLKISSNVLVLLHDGAIFEPTTSVL
jgi:hypothetical protein